MSIDAEILAPAGSPAALQSAVVNGADAVYLGLSAFSARAGAENFNTGNLREWTEYAHLFGVKVYVAVNTLIKQSEMKEALTSIRYASECGADAFIVQDLGLVREIRRTMPDVTLHASTQMGIHNLEGALWAEGIGFTRVVLSRETPLPEIRRIRSGTKLELEYFVHGALCVAFSGNCYISSGIAGLSGNRGRCLQLCRKKYRAVCDGRAAEGFLLSPADLCMADRLAELAAAGVCSFKIEGRLRRKEYVGETVRIYKKALSGQIDETDRDALKLLFNRGDYRDGYLSGKDVIYPLVQSHIGLPVGTVAAVGKTAKLRTTVPIAKGDGLKFLRNGKEVGAAECTGNRETTFTGRLRPGDSVRLTTSRAFLASIDARERRRRVSVSAQLAVGEPVVFCAESDGVRVQAVGEPAQSAASVPIDTADVVRVLKKSGPLWEPEPADISVGAGAFVPMSALNELRRNLYDKLRAACLAQYDNSRVKSDIPANVELIKHKNLYTMSDILYRIDERQLKLTLPGTVLYAPSDYSDFSAFEAALAIYGDRLILDLPILAERADLELLEKYAADVRLKTVCVNNPYGFTLAKEKAVLTGYGMNCLNDRPGEAFIQSVEADGIVSTDAYVYAFGYFPLMTFKHCPRRTVFGNCDGCRGAYDMRIWDEKGAFTIRRRKVSGCYAQLFNELPLNIMPELDRCGHKKRIVDLTGWSVSDAVRIVRGELPEKHIHFNFNGRLV